MTTNTNPLDISGRAILVGVSIHTWMGSKRDKVITDDICVQNNVRNRQIKATKNLLGDRYKPVKASEEGIRNYVSMHTLPWTDTGQRILKTTALEGFRSGLIAPLNLFKKAVSTLIDNYDEVKEESERNLGLAYDEDDFPPLEKLKRRFYVDINYLPVPTSSDFRITLSDEELEMIKRNCDATLRSNVNAAMLETVQRIREPIEHMTRKLRGYSAEQGQKVEGVFRDTVVENIRAMIGLIPNLNITENPEIVEIHRQMNEHLAQHDAAVLRVSPSIRNQVATEAERILERLQNSFN